MKAILPILAILLFATFPAQAEQFGLFTNEVTNGEITITDYPQDATGPVEILAEVDGRPVTSIGWGRFPAASASRPSLFPRASPSSATARCVLRLQRPGQHGHPCQCDRNQSQ